MKKSNLLSIVCFVLVVAVVAAFCVGCVPTSSDKVAAKLEKAGYTVYSAEDDAAVVGIAALVEEYSPDYAETVEEIMYAEKAIESEEEDADSDFVALIFVGDKENAKALYDDLSKYFSESDEEEEEEEQAESDIEIRRAGAVVYYGTASGLRAANK